MAFSVNNCSDISAFGPGFPDFLHPVAFLAALSAASLPRYGDCIVCSSNAAEGDSGGVISSNLAVVYLASW
jgi:hypothetical protein